MTAQATYEEFFGLTERPFELTTSPRYLCLTATHREALSSLTYALSLRGGLTLLIGDAGTGKSTVLRAALDHRSGPQEELIQITNPSLTRAEFFELLAFRFGLSDAAAVSKARFLIEVERLLIARRHQNIATVLVVDEAQSVDDQILEEIRLLANLEDDGQRLMAVILAGQPAIAARLNRPALQQLKQRVAVRCTLSPLSVADTAAYISTRIRISGGEAARVLTSEAVHAVHRASGGVPRVINTICGTALLVAFGAGVKPVGVAQVSEACASLDLGGRFLASTSAPSTFTPTPTPAPAPARAAAPVAPNRQYFGDITRRLRLGDTMS